MNLATEVFVRSLIRTCIKDRPQSEILSFGVMQSVKQNCVVDFVISFL